MQFKLLPPPTSTPPTTSTPPPTSTPPTSTPPTSTHPTPSTSTPPTPTPTIPASQCNTGPVQCCDSVQQANDSSLTAIFALLGINASDITGLMVSSLSVAPPSTSTSEMEEAPSALVGPSRQKSSCASDPGFGTEFGCGLRYGYGQWHGYAYA
ncbi:hypothetical protein D9611_000543 [Ephemerocybe angulata]|uniref:Hydrophobin n=1 Tax=Ephemerocybe angulata TaxID=980116 RepID=A0A8H5BM28_9AGAR|nr:hypothetical protein D9611_000543 [Tulosesus angulatus]